MAEALSVQPATPAAASTAEALALRVAGLRRDYGERTALRDVSLELGHGRTLVVIGPNGAGKTTLLRVLATLLRATAGQIEVLGSSLPAEAWRLRGRIGLMGHSALLYRDLTVEENMLFAARLHGIEEPEARIRELLAQAGLDRRTGDLVRNLSAGLAQRAAACRAILHDPALLLLDEPFAHLDPEATARLEPMLAAQPGRTVVAATHDVDAALTQADQVLGLRADGSPAYVGPPSGLSAGDARAIYKGTA